MTEDKKFTRPRIRPIDFAPIYGLLTYTSRWHGTSVNEEFRELKETIKEGLIHPVRSLKEAWRTGMGTDDWPKEPEYRRDTILTAIQNPLMVNYHLLLPPYAILYAFLYAATRGI